ncbi:hypothetical protein RhiirB3_438407 [Rhizophagus irregularis]|nr:hypothetical protein RhiirB3_438407 [Rhizophagus irregularis]
MGSPRNVVFLKKSKNWIIILNLRFVPSGSQDESQSYSNCSECKQKRTAVAWCKNCDIAIFKEIFVTGPAEILFIRDTQLNANENMDHLDENINKRGESF